MSWCLWRSVWCRKPSAISHRPSAIGHRPPATGVEAPVDKSLKRRANNLLSPLKRHPWRVLVGVLTILVLEMWLWGLGKNDVLEAAYAIPDGGGYCSLSDSGVSETIQHDGSVVLPASNGGSYCCG
jgi:hypothetical protein